MHKVYYTFIYIIFSYHSYILLFSILYSLQHSHFLQPCDSYIFISFKKRMQQMLAQKMAIALANERNLGFILIEIAHDAIKSITPNILKVSFETTGLFPFSKEKYQ